MLKPVFLFFILISFFACTEDPKEEISAISYADSIKAVPDTTRGQPVLENELKTFSNIEQVEYCVPLPLKEYTRDTKGEYERAKFVFINKKNDQLQMIVQGMFRSDQKISIEEYFKNSYPAEDAENGKNIEIKELIKATNCFYAKGFWSNFAIDQRFIEVTWLRPDDLVKMYVSYDVKDSLLWNSRLKRIIETDSYCK